MSRIGPSFALLALLRSYCASKTPSVLVGCGRACIRRSNAHTNARAVTLRVLRVRARSRRERGRRGITPSTMSDVALELLSVTFTQAPLGLRLDAYGLLAAVLDTAEESTQRLRPCDELVGINGTLYDDVPTDSTPDAAAELCDLVGEYVEAGAFPLTLTFRRDPSLMCQPVGACFERRSIAPSCRSSSGGPRRRRTWRSSRSPKRRRTLAASPSPIYASQTSSSSLSTIHPPGNAPLFSSIKEDAPASPGAAPAFAPPPDDIAASPQDTAAEPAENAAPALTSPDAAEPADAAPVVTTTITRRRKKPRRYAEVPDAPASRWAEGSAATPAAASITPAAPPPFTPVPPAAPVPPVTLSAGAAPIAPPPIYAGAAAAPPLRTPAAPVARAPQVSASAAAAAAAGPKTSQRSSSSRSCPVAWARSFLPSMWRAVPSTPSPSPRRRTRACRRCSRSPQVRNAPARWRCWTNCDAITASRRSLSACGRDAAATSVSLGRRARRSDSRVTEPSSPSSGTTRRSSLEAKCGRRPLRWGGRRPRRAHSPRRRPPRRPRRRPRGRRSCRQ